MGNKVGLTKELLEKEYVFNGKTLTEIGQQVGCSNVTVGNYCKKFGITIRPNYRDLTNQTFGELTAIKRKDNKRVGTKGCWAVVWECICSCGNIVDVFGNSLTTGNTTSCGHCRDPKVNERYGQITILQVIPSGRMGCKIIGRCDCGNIVGPMEFRRLGSGNNTSCGHCTDPKVGNIFGRLVVIEVITSPFGGCSVICRCMCGNIVGPIRANCVIRGNTSSCGCIRLERSILVTKLTAVLNNNLTNHPRWEVLQHEWEYDKNNPPVTYGANNKTKVYWKCKDCQYIWLTTIGNRVGKGTGCPKCKSSKIEKQIERYLRKHNIQYQTQYYIKSVPGYHTYVKIDFFLLQHQKYIEGNGEQHYQEMPVGAHGIKTEQEAKERFVAQQLRDKQVRELLGDKLIEIPYWDYDNIEQILTKELKINGDECHHNA